MAEKTHDTLIHDTLKDIYYAERKILKSLPKMARAAQSPELKAAFEKHKGQTEGQIERLQQVFELIGKPARTLEQVRGQGLAALIATHNPDLARRMDRVVTLRDGKIVAA